MLSIHVENIGAMAVVECEGRIVRSDTAYYLRDAVISQADSEIIVLDLSEVTAVAGGGLGMLGYLQQWASSHHLSLKLFNPTESVRNSLSHASTVPKPDIASLDEVMALLRYYQICPTVPVAA